MNKRSACSSCHRRQIDVIYFASVAVTFHVVIVLVIVSCVFLNYDEMESDFIFSSFFICSLSFASSRHILFIPLLLLFLPRDNGIA